MTALRPQPLHWADYQPEPPVEPMRGWPLLLVWAGAAGFCLAVWTGVIAATVFLIRGLD